jgi:serine/threonine protein kinase
MERLGKYTVLGELGRGAMGIVYLGEDPYIGRKVALKTIRFESFTQPSDQEMAQQRFMREARSAGNLSHPNIVTIYEVGEDMGMTFIAMEYIEGQSLEDLIASGKKFSLEEIAGLVARIGDALDYAHQKGVIHRDIKPANILIDREGFPHIVDFGIARFTSSTMTLTRAVVGTPYYMSPEQVAGKEIDHRTDIFSLGTILYELLTGNKPFPGDSITTVMYKIVHEDPPPVHPLLGRFPPGIDHVLSRVLAKKPPARFKSCRELSGALSGLKGQPEIPLSVKDPLDKAARPPLAPAKKKKISKEIPEEIPEYLSPGEKSRKPILSLLLAMMVLVVIATISIYFYFNGKRPLSPQGGQSTAPVSTLSSEETSLAAGKDLLQRGLYQQALTSFRSALSRDSRNFEARLGAADALRELGKLDEAAQEYEKAVALNETDPRPHLYLGEMLDRQGKKEEALDMFERFLTLSPKSADTGRVSRRIEEIEKELSAENIPAAKEEAPARMQPEEEKKTDETEPAVAAPEKVVPEAEVQEITPPSGQPVEKKAKEEGPDVDLDQMFDLGMQALRQKDYELCIARLESVLKYDPDHSEARYYLAVAKKSREEEEKQKEAEQRLARQIQDELQAAARDFSAGKYQESIDRANEVLRLDRENSKAREYITSANLKMAPGQIQAVVNSYIQSILDKRLVSFYQTRCVPSLYQKIRRDTETTLKLYDDFQALASNVKSDVRLAADNRYQAQVSFSHILTGVSRSKQTREVLFEGTITWNMEKRDNMWRILEVGYSESGK